MMRLLCAACLGSLVVVSACSILAPTDDDLLGGSTAADASVGGAGGSAGSAGAAGAAGSGGAASGGASATGGSSGSSGAGGSAGSSGAGTGAAAGAGGSAGSAGSGGNANCRPKPTGGKACGTTTCACGSVDCQSYTLGGVFNVGPCCGDNALCGIQIEGAVASAAGLATGCYAEQPPGSLDSSCPKFLIPNPSIPGSDIEFPGCCTPAGNCGISMDLKGLGGPTLGCLEADCGGAAPKTCKQEP